MTTKKVTKKKFLKYIWVSKVVDIGLLRPDTITKLIMDVVKVMNKGLKRPDTVPQVIVEFVETDQV